jgi:hypothetical protein
MGALSFMGQFVPMVEAGLKNEPGGKRQSIRNFRRRPLKVGETLSLYFAQRSKWCRKLGTDKIKDVFIVQIAEKYVKIYAFRWDWQRNARWDLMDAIFLKKAMMSLKLVGVYKKIDELNSFAQADGFKDWETMKRWWIQTHGRDALPFNGNLYTW